MNEAYRCLPLVCAGVLATLAVAGQESDLEERLHAVAAQAGDELAGLTTLVWIEDRELLAEGFGVSDPNAHELAGPDSRYRVGGLTPSLISIGILQLVDTGRLDLDAPVAELLAERTIEEEQDAEEEGAEEEGAGEESEAAEESMALDERVTLRHLLAHTSGLPAAEVFLASTDAALDDSRQAFLAWLGSTALDSDPGECFRFDATNVLLAGWILEDVAEQSVPEYLTEHVFTVLELDDTGYQVDGPPRGELWEAHVELGNDLIECGFALESFRARDLCSTARDLAALMRGLIDREVLSDDGFDALREPPILPDGGESPAGLGAYRVALGEHVGLAFGGGTAGARVHLAWYPSFDLTVVTLALGRHAPVDRLERSLSRLVFQQPEPGFQDLALSSEERALYLGGYYVACTRIAIQEQGERLVAAWPDGRTVELAYQGYHVFLDQGDPEVRLTFEIEDGQAVAFALEEHGLRTVAKRID